MDKLKLTFKVYVNEEGKYFSEQNKEESLKEIELAVVKPSYELQQKAQIFYSKTFKKYAEAEALLRPNLDDILRKNKLWDDEKEKQLKEVQSRINHNVFKITKGGCKLSDAVKAAKQIIKDRMEILNMTIKKNELDRNTAEYLAENERYNYLVAGCTVYNDSGERFFKNYDEFLKFDEKNGVVTNLAGQKFWELTSGLDQDIRRNWPEYKFLSKYGFCDDKLRLIRKSDGKFVDLDDNLVDEDNRRVNENGQLIDLEGKVIDKDGNYVVEFEPFIEE